MSANHFPSGPWTGYYCHGKKSPRHRMDLALEFTGGRMQGDGTDDIGPFRVVGSYDAKSGDCRWTKFYVGAHSVDYRGFGEEMGIWGTWTLNRSTGGFHIWPLQPGDEDILKMERAEDKILDDTAAGPEEEEREFVSTPS